jgi:hypothetical protein
MYLRSVQLYINQLIKVNTAEPTWTRRNRSPQVGTVIRALKTETLYAMRSKSQHRIHDTGLTPLGCQMYNHGSSSDNTRSDLS